MCPPPRKKLTAAALLDLFLLPQSFDRDNSVHSD